MKQLGGALVLVTGAGSGIGRSTALTLAREGARVLAVDIDADAAKRSAVECQALPGAGEAHGLWCDVADHDAVATLATEVQADHGPLDVLVNNAGVGMSARLADMSIDDWRWIRGINLDGVVHGCHAFGPAMLASGQGHVVNISSGLGYTPRATEPAYVTTKAAVLAFSQSLRADWRPQGVSVSAVCPGVIDTPILESTRFLGQQANDAVRKRAEWLFRRLGHKPDAVAKAVLRAIRRDRIMVAVGWEAKVGWAAHRVLPLSVHQAGARRGV
jgi:NAD(P)-dependent dehydrogenase (short-subunit alcohol dehydrogenase family)